ncbi:MULTISPECIES: CinA family protein [unclassified Halomonas]|uniref:CinA family protein n=1 Tax=Halomonas sp. H10-59 TaxID=2950874 RepID=A0AAU7KS04_9GAMM|nr:MULTISPECIES: CinA family protein [unclassified Halomonas]MBR9769499.1 CinA family protein [Gammaproteobacteria bacterium]MBS8268711.1 CinA family protein [Halomonas litopenaei]KJZ17711.1 damage-inducible protein CinA [Halomonas sp. S2151]MAR74475.1 CinA family protein [Halomonas sp.]MBR9880396.1 CinA family protein [Gammaproteobacteria bacterium]|tara:strand:+ start:101 stop:601 length:501 start_codon:yes stop_codon:yes gene_type:complete
MTNADDRVRRLAIRLGELCVERGVSVTAAESCTGGGVAAAITDIAGSSRYFETGYVTYSNAAKQRLLGVPGETLDAHGAVSQPVVEAMVEGACRDSGARLGVSVSGVAGPDGGSAEKPVGTVWFAFAVDGRLEADRQRFAGGRDEVRQAAVVHALEGLIRRLESLT